MIVREADGFGVRCLQEDGRLDDKRIGYECGSTVRPDAVSVLINE